MAIVGRPLERVEDPRLLRGRGTFVGDLARPGMLYAAIARSELAHARLLRVDTSRAAAMPGVRALFTAADVRAALGRVPMIPLRLAALPELSALEQSVVAVDHVRYVGEPIAVVVADSAALAEDAVEAVEAELEPLGVVGSLEQAARTTSLLFPAHRSNAAITYTATRGDACGATGPYTRRERFSVQRHTAVPLETRGLLAAWDDAAQRMTVHGAAKVPYFVRRTLAGALDLPLDSVEMIEVDVGGGFGARGEYYPEDFLVPFAARRLRCAVKWVEDRREHLLGTNHSRESDCELEIVCERDGRVIALRGSVRVNCGAYMRSNGTVPPRNIPQFIAGPYDIPNIHVESTAYLTNRVPSGTYRGPGFYEADFFRERLFDIAARDLGIDPVTFRRRNLVTAQSMPYSMARLDKPDRGETLDGGDYTVTLDHCLREIGWEAKRALQGNLVDGWYHGLAIGCYVEGTAVGPKETVRISIERDGTFAVYLGSANKGQGLETVMTQIAADALHTPPESIRIFHGSTTYLADGVGAFHSRSTVMGGSAIVRVAEVLRETIRAAHASAGRELSLPELGALGLEASGEFTSEHRTFGFGSAAAHVRVDPRTGRVEVIDYFVVQDIGRVINPGTAKGQLIGAAAQGLGGAFLEEIRYDEYGQLVSGSLADHLLPLATDFPVIRAALLETSPSMSNPLGAKGVGEGGIIAVAGVVSNAIAAALASFKVEPRTLPLSPAAIWALLHPSARESGAGDRRP